MRHRLIRPAAVLVALALVFAACGDDGDDKEGAPSGSGDAPKGEPIRIMAIGTFSGPFDLGYVADSARAAAKAINDAGGIKGRPLEVETCDDHGNPNDSQACGRKAAEAKVVAVVSIASEGGYVEALQAAGIPIIGPYGGAIEELTSENSFPLTGGGPGLAANDIAVLLKAGAKKIRIVHEDSESGKVGADLATAILQRLGGTNAGLVPMPTNAPDGASYVASATKGDVEGVALLVLAASAAKYLSAASQAGKADVLHGIDDANLPPAIVQTLGQAAEGVLIASGHRPIGDGTHPGIKKYLSELEAFKASLSPNEFPIVTFSQHIWASVHLFAEVAEKASTIDSASILTGLAQVDDFDSGVTCPVSFTKPSTAIPMVTRVFNTSVFTGKIEKGAFKADSDRCEDLIAVK